MSREFAPLVLCYHGVSGSVEHDLLLPPDALLAQVRLMLRRGYRPATAEAALAGPGRLLHVTFDDAFRNIGPVLAELRGLGVPVTVFACTDLADSGVLSVPELERARTEHPEAFEVMGWDELRALADDGVTIGSHTCSHPRLTTLADSELDRELRESKERLEDGLGRPCGLLAYPYGDRDERVQAAASRAGYEAAFALRARARGFDPHAVPRVDLYRGHGLLHAAIKTSAAWRRLQRAG